MKTHRGHRARRAVLIALALAVPPTAGAFQEVLQIPAARTPLAVRTLLNGVARAGQRLVTVGQRGHILYSDDRGRSWLQASVPVSADLVAVVFPSPRHGWAVGHDGVVLHSADGGLTWTSQLSGPASAALGPDRSFLDVWFDDEASGFAVGAFNLVVRTTDGGRTWERWSDRTDNPRNLHLYAIRRIGGDLFVAGEQGLVMKLDRVAERFRALKTPYQGTFFGITGVPGTVIVFGLRGNAFRSADGGARWSRVETGVEVGLTGATVTDDRRIVLVSQEGHALVSADAGATFRQIRFERPFPASAVASIASDELVLAGTLGVRVQPLR
jgi:photosystem II stability/assembly factor-like uncharacterized protein